MGIVIPVLPHLIEEFVGSNARAGLLNGVFVALWAGMQFLASPVIGSLSDQYGRRPVILLSCAGLAADYVLMALAPNLWWLAVGRLVAGVTSSSFTTIYAYMADITEPEKRARAYGLIGAAFSGGFVLGPVLGGFLGEFGPRVPFWVAGALSGVAFLYGLFILPESLPLEKRMPFSWRRANPVGAMILLKRHAELAGLAVVNFLLYFAHHVFSAVFVLYAGLRYGWGPWQVGALLAMVGVLDMIVQGVLVGPASKRFGDRATMIFGLCGGAVGIALMGWAPTGVAFIVAMFPNALWGLAIADASVPDDPPRRRERAGPASGREHERRLHRRRGSPLFFGWIYSVSVGEGGAQAAAWLSERGLPACPLRRTPSCRSRGWPSTWPPPCWRWAP
ncbi:MFS transporter [Brevundimonas vancanneytii]|uniref:Tetracycline resistance protein, class C n=1 Tax=Brevundimonas vancanneytii TaxID=1325724 RepID=A0A4P1K7T7_9CAUL|nr:MFS transporter [Brevundimonas vancanneytii]VTO16450.1 Tetracycline resistance protein, class C [Brevundimonas vancanneytii]